LKFLKIFLGFQCLLVGVKVEIKLSNV
jgi:hypothetical protein